MEIALKNQHYYKQHNCSRRQTSMKFCTKFHAKTNLDGISIVSSNVFRIFVERRDPQEVYESNESNKLHIKVQNTLSYRFNSLINDIKQRIQRQINVL